MVPIRWVMPKWGSAIAIWCLVRACLAVGPVPRVPTPRFEENAGQSSSQVRFLVRAPGYAGAFERDGVVLYAAPPGTPDFRLVQMRLLGGAFCPALNGEGDPVTSTMLYRGAFDSLGLRLRSYEAIRYHGVYPGIDWVWHFQEGALEFQFELDPGADPASIWMAFTGVSVLRLDRDGNLDLDGGAGLRYRRPEAWQNGPLGRIAVPVAFRIDSGIVTFDVGPHDASLPLTIDPVVKYSRYLGGAGYDAAYAVATDAAGSVYVTGETGSVDFSSSSGVRYNRDAFVSKLSPDGGQVLYTAILSSGGNDAGKAIAVDGGGNVWIAGMAGGSGFPVTSGAVSSYSSGAEDAFVARVDSNGLLKYATYLGGGGTDVATALAIDLSGNVYVAGYTSSVNFPTTSGAPQTNYQGGTDAFLVKLSASGGFLSYSTLLGGSGNDSFNALSVDASGSACAAGQTSSSNLPVRNAVQATYGGNGDALLACLNPTGTAWSTLTYMGGSGLDEALGIARDGAGNIYLAGDTYSYDFPTTLSAYRKVSAGAYDAFAVKLNSAGDAIVFATLLGGSASDSATAISVDASGKVWIAGYTASVDFPVTGSPSFGGYFDGFLAQLSTDGSSLLWAGYLGGSGDDRCLGMALSATGEPIVVGLTGSANFPITVGASPAPYNAFVMGVAVNLLPILSIAKTHTGNFTQGQSNVVYTVIVSNQAGAGTTSGTVTVTESVPAGLTLVSMAGTGWTCPNGGTTCTRSDALAAGSIYPAITVTVNVAPNAPSLVTNQVGVSGGGAVTASAGDLTGISTSSDFSGDGHPGIIWQDPVTGLAQVWSLGGAQGTSTIGAANLTASNTWRIVGVGDFNHDGRLDVVWQDPVSGAAQVWFLGGAQGNVVTGAATLSNGNSWRIMSVADFNGDGRPDVIWQDPATGLAQIWFMGGVQGTTVTGAVNLTASNTWRIVGTGDFNQDGHPDVLWQDPVSGTTQIWYLGGTQGNVVTNAVNLTGSNPWRIASVADFNLDGHPDVVFQDPVSGASQVWFLGGTQGTTVTGTAALSGSNLWRIAGPR